MPLMIAGEGGWRPGEAQDAALPGAYRRKSSRLSCRNLPMVPHREAVKRRHTDYLFAFCPWLVADPS